jgi:hypothetical protein
MTAVLDASPHDSSHVEQPSTMPSGVSALGAAEHAATFEIRSLT